MRDAPDLPTAVLEDMLQHHYGIASPRLEFLPLGNDSGTFVYRVETAAARARFLKLRALDRFREASLLVPRSLHERGVPNVLAPLPAHDGAAWVRLGAYAAALYPFLTGRTATEARLSPASWRDLGATLRQVHDTNLSATLQAVVPSETFTTDWHERFTSLETRLVRETGMWIVDWDEVVLAPKERDLMFVIGGIGRGLVESDETASFLGGYGETDIDPEALAYYRYAWALRDIETYVGDALGEALEDAPGEALGDPNRTGPARTEAARWDAATGFATQFEEGNMVEIALGGSSLRR